MTLPAAPGTHGALGRREADDDDLPPGILARSSCLREDVEQRRLPRHGIGAGLLHLAEDEDPLRAVLLDADGDLRVDEIVLPEKVPEESLDGPWRESGHADIADQRELERPVRRDDDLAREVLVSPDGDLQDVLGPDPVFLDGATRSLAGGESLEARDDSYREEKKETEP